MKILKVIVILASLFNITVFGANAGAVLCDSVTDNNITSVYVLADENGNQISESDIMVFISDEVKKCTENKTQTVILTITDGLASEENIAKIIEGIDVICVNGNAENKTNCIIDDTTVVYSEKGVEIAPMDIKEADKKNKSPVEILFSKLVVCVVLIIASIATLLVVKRKQQK